MKKITIAIISIIILSFAIAAYSYQKIDGDEVASHWDASGQINGYMPKFWGLFLLPTILIGIYLLFLLIPKIDPLKKNIQKFSAYYDLFQLGFFIYMFYIFILTMLANLGYKFNMTTMIMPAIALLFFCLGIFLKKLKRNWFIGIRTPWTISNDVVWDKTHALGSRLFKAIGITILVGMFFQEYLIEILLIPVFISVIWLSLYSYLEFRKIEKKK